MWAQIRQNDTTSSPRWREDAWQEISVLQQNSLNNAQASRFIFSKASRILSKAHPVAFASTLKVHLYSSQPNLIILVGVVCTRTTFHLIQKFFGKRLLLSLALYTILLFLLSILQKLFLFRSCKIEVLPQSLYKLVLSQHVPQSATMRFLFHHCLPLPRLQRRLALCRQSFVVSSVTSSTTIEANCQTLRAWLLQRLSHQNISPRGLLSALGTKLISSASSWLKINDPLT